MAQTENNGAVVLDNMEGTEKERWGTHFRWIVFAVHAATALGFAIALSALICGSAK